MTCRGTYKGQIIRRMLEQRVAASVTIRPSFGELVLVEHVFHNPLQSAGNFELQYDDPDLQLVSKTPRASANGMAC